jgi:hypothetical protein
MRMNLKELIVSARLAAKYLPAVAAKLVNEMANRLDYTHVALCEALRQRDELKAELARKESV